MSDSDLSMPNPFLSSSSSDNELEEAFNEWILACQKVDEARSKSSKRRRRRTHVERGREQGEAQSGNDYFSEVSMYTDAKSAELYFHNETQALMSVDVLDTASKNLNTPATNGDSEVQSPANDMEKKVLRAERFGVPLQLSEKEKRNSRAERFGSVSDSDVKSSKELKRKARAERFGLPADSAVDNEEKKKARVARLGSDLKVDSQEEEKRKAKALRSAQSPADSQTNTVGDSEYYGDSEYC